MSLSLEDLSQTINLGRLLGAHWRDPDLASWFALQVPLGFEVPDGLADGDVADAHVGRQNLHRDSLAGHQATLD
jgi:hypothetical protein